jgi:hypothetical protein
LVLHLHQILQYPLSLDFWVLDIKKSFKKSYIDAILVLQGRILD